MKNILLSLLFFLISLGAKSQPFNPLLAGMLQDTLNTYVSQITNIKGMSASVYIPGQGVWNGVSGNSFAGQPITTDMRFGIASNSKLFCSVMLLKLAEKNIISLADSLKDWLTISNPNINPNITIRQLLNHSSGISDPFFASPWFDTINLNPTRVFTPNEVLGWVGAPLFPAGTNWGYSNTNYVLAGMVAKSATGRNLSALIRDSILTPLNLNNTFIDVEEPVNGTIAHRWWNSIDYHDTSRVGLNSAVGYAGSIFSKASDMAQWYTALFNGQVINQSSMNELTGFLTTSNPAYQYGLGLSREVTQGYQYWGHGGRTWGYKSKMIYDTCLHVTVAGLANSDPAGMDGVTFLLYRAVKNHIPGCSGAITGLTTVCKGSNGITYTVPPIANALSYTWTLPTGATGTSNTNSITVNFGTSAVSGNIAVQGVNNYGGGGTSSLPVTVNPVPPAPVITQNGNILSSSAPSGNQWYNAGGIIAGATAPTYTISSSGTYYTIVTVAGCSSAPSNSINAVVTAVTSIGNGGSWKIYPNPVSEYFLNSIEGISVLHSTLRIFNTAGVLLKTEKILHSQQYVDVNRLSPGVYMIELRSGVFSARQKLVIQR